MDRPFEGILLSRPITFVIGPKQREFIVHEKVISAMSKPLSALLTGDMKEAKEGRVVWDDVDEQTFVRFGQWAYIADYEAGAPHVFLDSSSIVTDTHGNNEAQSITTYSLKSIQSGLRREKYTCDNCGYRKRSSTSSTTKRWDMVNAFMNSSDWPSTTPFTPRVNDDPCEDYTEVFLSHARLYVLGDKYDISPLCKLAAHKLNETLKVFPIYAGKMGSILALAEYVFENTRSDDKIRSLLTHFMACIVEDLYKEAEFTFLVESCPEAASDLIAKISERLT